MVGSAPLTTFSIPELTQQLFNPISMTTGSDFRNGRYLNCSVIFRGKVSASEVEELLHKVQQKTSTSTFKWIPGNIQTSLYSIPHQGLEMSSTFVGNSTAIQEVFKRITEPFAIMFRRKAFLRPYIREGIDEMEFTEAEYNMNDLISEYQQYQDEGPDDACGSEGYNKEELPAKVDA